MNPQDFKHFQKRMRELRDKFGMDALQIEGLTEPSDPATKNLGQLSREHDFNMHQGRGLKTSYGHAYVKTGNGEMDFKPVRIWFDWKP